MSGGGVLTEGGAARTICLLAHPAVARAIALRERRNLSLLIMYFAPRPCLDREDESPPPPTAGRAATRFERWCRARLRTQIRWNHYAIARSETCSPGRCRCREAG